MNIVAELKWANERGLAPPQDWTHRAIEDFVYLLRVLEKIDTGCDCAPYTSCEAMGPVFRCRSCLAREAILKVTA